MVGYKNFLHFLLFIGKDTTLFYYYNANSLDQEKSCKQAEEASDIGRHNSSLFLLLMVALALALAEINFLGES